MKIRVLGLATLCLGLALTAVAQRGPRGGAQGPRGGDPETREGSRGEREDRDPLGRLVAALDLNEAQVGAAEALLAVRIEATEDIQEPLLALRQSIPDLIAAGYPTPIGIAVLAQHALQEHEDPGQKDRKGDAGLSVGDFIDAFGYSIFRQSYHRFGLEREQSLRGKGGYGHGSTVGIRHSRWAACVLNQTFVAQQIRPGPIRSSSYSGRLGYRLGVCPQSDDCRRYFGDATISFAKPLNLAIRMIASIAVRSARMAVRTTERNPEAEWTTE